jgi:hypothetical protein
MRIATAQDFKGAGLTRKMIEEEAEFIFSKMSENMGDAYWQGRLDSLSWALKNLGAGK